MWLDLDSAGMDAAVQERNIADTGLNLLLEMLIMFERSEFATQFHQTYYLMLVREIFVVMTGMRTLVSSAVTLFGISALATALMPSLSDAAMTWIASYLEQQLCWRLRPIFPCQH